LKYVVLEDSEEKAPDFSRGFWMQPDTVELRAVASFMGMLGYQPIRMYLNNFKLNRLTVSAKSLVLKVC